MTSKKDRFCFFFMVAISLSSVAAGDSKRPIFLEDSDQRTQAERLFWKWLYLRGKLTNASCQE